MTDKKTIRLKTVVFISQGRLFKRLVLFLTNSTFTYLRAGFVHAST